MPNNFHDINGLLLLGIDRHFALLMPGVPVPFVPTPIPAMTKLNFLHPFTMGGDQKGTVFFNGVNAVGHWHQPRFLWPHLGLPPFPFDVLTPLQIALGQQTCWLPRGSVLLEGGPASPCAIAGPISINLDCWELGNFPSSLVVQPGTVQTSPSLADYKAGIVMIAIDFAINLAFEVLLMGVGKGFKFARRGASRSRQAIGRGMASRVAPSAPAPRAGLRNTMRRLFGRAEEAAAPALPGPGTLIDLPHQVQKRSTCGLNCLNMMIRNIDPEFPTMRSVDLIHTARRVGVDRPTQGVHLWDLQQVADELGYKASHNAHVKTDAIRNLIDRNMPVMTAVPVDSTGFPTTTGAQELHAVVVKGHYQHPSGTDMFVISHPWSGAETIHVPVEEFEAARAAGGYWNGLIVSAKKPPVP